jgi:hypothetical protein
MNPIDEQLLESHYHEVLKNINKVYNHPLMAGTPALRANLTEATNALIKLRDLTKVVK